MQFLSWHYGHVEKRFGYIVEVNCKTYDTTAWLKNNRNTYIAQYLKK